MSSQSQPYHPPFDYPRGFVKWLMQLPILLYRLGLGRLIGSYILLLTTTGRKSGKPRVTAIEHRRIGEAYYVVSGWGAQADWYRNILKDPHVHVRAGAREFDSVADALTGAEKLDVVRLRWGDNARRALRSQFRLKTELTDEQIAALLRDLIIVRLRPV